MLGGGRIKKKVSFKYYRLTEKALSDQQEQRVHFLNKTNRDIKPLDEVIPEIKKLYTDLLILSTGERLYERQVTEEYILNGFRSMFHVMESGAYIVSAPKEKVERENLYLRLANGYRTLGYKLKEEQAKGNIDKQMLYGCLEVVGDGGFACVARWKQVLEEMMFSLAPEQRYSEDATKENSIAQTCKNEMFRAKFAEVNGAAKEFVSLYYPNYGNSLKVHYEAFFKRYLNKSYQLNLAIHHDEDPLLDDDKKSIQHNAKAFLSVYPLRKNILKRLMKSMEELIATRSGFFTEVVNYAQKNYFKQGYHKEFKDPGEYLSTRIFHDYSMNIQKMALYELLSDFGYVVQKTETVELQKVFRDIIRTPEGRKDLIKKNFEALEWILQQQSESVKENVLVKDILHLQNNEQDSLLMLALKFRNKVVANFLLDKDAPVHVEDREQNTPLMESIVWGERECITKILEKNPILNVVNQHGATALSMAIEREREDIIDRLLERGADVNVKNKDGVPLFFSIIQKGDQKMMDKFMQIGVDLNETNMNQDNAFLYACKLGKVDVVEYLVSQGADVRSKDQHSRGALWFAVRQKNETLFNRALALGAELNNTDYRGDTPLMLAINMRDEKMIDLLLKSGIDANIPNVNGLNALMRAATNGNLDIVKKILPHMNNIDAQDKLKESAIFKSIQKKDGPITEYLLKNGANIQLQNSFGMTLLMIAAHNGDVALCQRLMKSGADLNLKSNFGLTALGYAVHHRQEDTAKVIFAKHDKKDLVNNGGDQIVLIAARSGFCSIIGMLKKIGVNINVQDAFGETALMSTVRSGDVKTTQFLLEQGSDIKFENCFGLNAIQIAEKFGTPAIRKLLAEAVHGKGDINRLQKKLSLTVDRGL